MIKPIENWMSRHKNPASFWLHMLGIPACFIVAPILLIIGEWFAALMFFLGGYAIQFIGHLIEGNKSGEELLIHRLLKLDKPKDEKKLS